MLNAAAVLGVLVAVVWAATWALQLAVVAVIVLCAVGGPLLCLLIWLALCVLNPADAKRIWAYADQIDRARR